ncbi:hypothetical protein [Telmatospirillum sp. J64-1]|uniref:hypothetical protein n=1 Tax=Telmatospirillum sp. J64-1 TaxID=2502183 RepID=UPI00115D7EE9|nr:hypothetical protein [Telmatospirillum sp. J64-1]
MAAKSRSAIIAEIEHHIDKHGGIYTDWFVGYTATPKKRLFTDHGVRQNGDAWIARRALDDLQAREVEEYFRSVRRCGGVATSGNPDAVYVYAYLRKRHTKP